jgi:hypothetical protein
MPALSIDKVCANFNGNDEKLLRAAFNHRTDTLRAAKPFRRIDFDADDALFKACANYVWRILCFDHCSFHPHNCIPVAANRDVNTYYRNCGDTNNCRAIEQELRLNTLIMRVEMDILTTIQVMGTL